MQLVSPGNSGLDGIQQSIQGAIDVGFGLARLSGEGIDQFGFVHRGDPYGWSDRSGAQFIMPQPLVNKGCVALAKRARFRKATRPTNNIIYFTMIDFQSHRFEQGIMLTSVRWYMAYPLSDRNLEEMMDERGVEVDHSTISCDDELRGRDDDIRPLAPILGQTRSVQFPTGGLVNHI